MCLNGLNVRFLYICFVYSKTKLICVVVVLNTTPDPTSSEPEYLFRAYKYTGTETGRPTFIPEIDVPFSLEYRRTIPVDEFIWDLAGHLGKTRRKTETYFVSMSPILEWTLHKAGQISRENPNEKVGLAIFDVTKLHSNSDTTIFRVWDILEFLIQKRREYLTPTRHLTMGKKLRRVCVCW